MELDKNEMIMVPCGTLQRMKTIFDRHVATHAEICGEADVWTKGLRADQTVLDLALNGLK